MVKTFKSAFESRSAKPLRSAEMTLRDFRGINVLLWLRYRFAPAALLLLVSISPGHAQVLSDFQGVWTINSKSAKQCTQASWKGPLENDHDGIFRITRQTVEYWESKCSVVRFRPEKSDSGTDRTATVDLACAGEGETWRTKEIWYLTRIDGRRVLVLGEVQRTEGQQSSRQAKPKAVPMFRTSLECK